MIQEGIAQRPVKPGAGKSVILLAAIFVAYAGEEVEHFAKTVNQSRMTAITTGTMMTAKPDFSKALTWFTPDSMIS